MLRLLTGEVTDAKQNDILLATKMPGHGQHGLMKVSLVINHQSAYSRILHG